MLDVSPNSTDDLPTLLASDALIDAARAAAGPAYLPESGIDFSGVRSTFAVALHMHQPLIPAGGGGAGGDPQTAPVVGN